MKMIFIAALLRAAGAVSKAQNTFPPTGRVGSCVPTIAGNSTAGFSPDAPCPD